MIILEFDFVYRSPFFVCFFFLRSENNVEWFESSCTVKCVLRISCQMPRDRSIRNNTERMSEVDRLRSVRPLIDPLSLLQARQRSLRHAHNVMSDLGHHWWPNQSLGCGIILQKLLCKRTIAFRFPIKAPWFPIKARKKSCVFRILIRPDDFEPIQNYVCINVDLLQIDTEIKGVNNIEKHQALTGSSRLSNS